MESEITSETATMSQIETGASLGGILSGIPQVNMDISIELVLVGNTQSKIN